MTAYKLTDTKLKSIRAPGLYSDGNCLYLQVKHGGRSWLLRYTSPTTRKMRDMGLGSADRVTLAQARQRAREALALIAEGTDPIDQRKGERAEIRAQQASTVAVPTFNQCWRTWDHKFNHGHPTHTQNQRAYIENYVLPVLQDRPVDKIGTDDIVKMIEPIWETKAVTAQRTLRVVMQIMRYARAAAFYTGDNPADWGILKYLLAKPTNKVVHFARIEPAGVPAFMTALRDVDGIAARCAEFTIHTAMRSKCVRWTRWPEIDLKHQLWTVPKERLLKDKKRDRPLLLPLTDSTAAIIEGMARIRMNDLVFPGQASDRPIANHRMLEVVQSIAPEVTVHGFRSSFKDWGRTQLREDRSRMFDQDTLELALAHAIRDATDAAYERDDALELRVPLMARWSAYLDGTL